MGAAMLTKCKVASLLALVLLLPMTGFADELFLIKGGYQLLTPEGSVAGTVNGEGTEIDVDRDLNLDDSENFTGEVALQWGRSRISLNYLPIDFSGTGTLTLDGTFNGQPFSVDDTVVSDLTIDLYDIGYTFYFINLDDLPARLQLGLEASVKVADAQVTLKNLNPDREFTETESVTAPIPTIGVRSRLALADFLSITGRIGYLEVDTNHFLDAEAQVEFSPLPLLGLYAGYRHFDLKIDEDDLFVETKFSGPFAGLFFRF